MRNRHPRNPLPRVRYVLRPLAHLVLIVAGARSAVALQAGPTLDCRPCRVVLGPPLTLGSVDDPASANYVSVVVKSQDRFYVARAIPPYEVLVYDSTGAFLRTIGRRGAGPGEFRFVHMIAAAPDGRIRTVDMRTRYTLWTPGMDRVLATASLPFAAWEGVTLPDGRMAVQPAFADPRVGRLFILSADGTIQHSFPVGDDPTTSTRRPATTTLRHTAWHDPRRMGQPLSRRRMGPGHR